MTTQTNPAQTEQPITPKLNPNFRHRLSILGDEADAYHVTDTVDNLAMQADCLIRMIQDQFIEGEERSGKLSDQIIYYSFEAVADLVADMKAICRAHHEATRTQADGDKGDAK